MATDRPIIFHHEAFAELEQAKFWYEEQAEGLGEIFFQEVQYAVSQIRQKPSTWPFYKLGTRRFFIHRFPFAIIYKDTPTEIHILAVMHLKRKPEYWKNRRSK